MTITLERPVATVTPAATVSRSELADALRFVCNAVPKRAPLVVLTGVLVDVADGAVTLSAYDYEMSCTTTVQCADSAPGRFLVGAHALAAAVGKPGPRVTGTVGLTVDGDTLVVSVAGGTATLPLLPLDDYPTLPDLDGAAVFAVLTAADVAAFPEVCSAAGKDDTLPTLQHVAFDSTAPGLELAATDRYRLTRYTSTTAPSVQRVTLIPAAALRLVALRLTGDVVMVFGFGASPGTTVVAGFTDSTGRTLSVRVGDDYTFPTWRSLWPADHAGTVTVDARALADAVAEVAGGGGKNESVWLRRGGNVWQVERRDDARNPVATRLVSCTFAGDVPDVVGFNPKYLVEALKASGGKGPVTVALTSPTKPATFTGAGPVRVLLMPVRDAG